MTVQELTEVTQINMTPTGLQTFVMQLPIASRLTLLKLLAESLQPEILMNLQTSQKRQWSAEFLSTFGAWEGEPLVREPQEEQTKREFPLEKFYGYIDDETFIRHPQLEQADREPLE
jgi:hypothetical protein